MIVMATDRPTERADLSRLVRERRADLGLSLAALEERAVDPVTGTRAKTGWTHRLEGEAPNLLAPTLAQLRALAAGLSLPLGTLQAAAGSQWFGLDTLWSPTGNVRALAERADELPPEIQRQLLSLVEAFVQQQQQ
ncbi:XRE family transcriptional regulator [Streptomyces sp. NPDC049881]|uniref:XRE family transcriptional regulator n=1 Tax=Streptomyces sp. NPDC049881 TaxID=3155778 RepID=UPI003448F5B7